MQQQCEAFGKVTEQLTKDTGINLFEALKVIDTLSIAALGVTLEKTIAQQAFAHVEFLFEARV